MNKTIIYRLSALVAAAFLLFSCHDVEEEIIDIHDDVDYETEESVSDFATYYMPSVIDNCISQAISLRFHLMTGDLQSAEAIVASSSDLEPNTEFLRDFLNRGGVLIEIEPSVEQHRKWFGRQGIPTAVQDEDFSIIATCGMDTYLLENIFEDSSFTQTENKSTRSASSAGESTSGVRSNYDVNVIEPGRNIDYCYIMINALVSWVNRHKQAPGFSASFESQAVPNRVDVSNLQDYLNNSDYTQHITKSLPVSYRNLEIASVMWSDEDLISRTSTVELEFDVTRFYAYNETNQAGLGGDYYIVNAKVTSYNKPMCKTYREWHGWVVTHAHALYLKDMNMSAQLVVPSKYNVTFFQTPKPETTSGSTTYSNGFTFDLSVNGQVGYMKGPVANITLGTKFSWNSSESHTLSDLSVDMSTDPATRMVDYHFKTHNVREMDELDDAIPAIARTTRTDYASWVWHVSGLQDDDEQTSFQIKIKASPRYAWIMRHATWTVEGFAEDAPDKLNYWNTFDLVAPDRVRRGIISLKNTADSNRYLDSVEIIDAYGQVVGSFSDDSAFHNETVERQVPVGVYTVRYDIVNGDDGTLFHSYEMTDVKVNTAETTSLWSYNGKIVD